MGYLCSGLSVGASASEQLTMLVCHCFLTNSRIGTKFQWRKFLVRLLVVPCTRDLGYQGFASSIPLTRVKLFLRLGAPETTRPALCRVLCPILWSSLTRRAHTRLAWDSRWGHQFHALVNSTMRHTVLIYLLRCFTWGTTRANHRSTTRRGTYAKLLYCFQRLSTRGG